MFKSIKRNKFDLSALAVAVSLMPLGAYAAGLGKVTVLSPLGQPLRAEVEITASREELSSMAAKVASPEAFKQAGIEYTPALTAIRIVVDKRPNGQPILHMLSDRAVNDPFLDVLVELTWNSGRMVREYTMLLDPPEALTVGQGQGAVTAPEAKTAPAVGATPTKSPEVAAPAAAPTRADRAVAPAKGGAAGSHTVKRGETLAKIAGENKPEGVSLDQMLVALFRANKDAFDGGNMNRLKTGKILSIPDQAAASGASPGEARKIVVSQARDFNVYRQRLASTVAAAPVAREEAPKQQAAGKITPKVEEKPAAPAPSKDKLEVSRTEAAKQAKAVQGRITALEEDLVVREKALKEANSRIAQLEKNLTDLKKLAELKSQAGAQMQQQAQPAKAPPAPAPLPAPAPAPEVKKLEQVPASGPAPASSSTPAPAEAPKAPEKPAEVAAVAPAEPVKPVESAPAPQPAESAEPPKVTPVAKKPAPVPPPEEPSFLDENATLVYGGGGVLALLLAYLGYSAMRRKREGDLVQTTSRITEGDLMANSVFGATGGQAVDTGASIQTDFSQSNLASIDTDEGVDPVAEADVYMAYGRDAQAEEILIDALKNDPSRHAIHLKLLEIYSGRKAVKQFEALATDLYGQTSGAGADWEKAAAMGRSLDPENPLYGGTGGGAAYEQAASAPVTELGHVLSVPATESQKLRQTVTMPGQLGAMAATATAAAEPPASMDFDLDLGGLASEMAGTPAPREPEVSAPLDLNLDIGLPSLDEDSASETVPTSLRIPMEGLALDSTVPLGLRATQPEPEPEGGLDFEFDLESASAPPAGTPAPGLSIPSINLDLDTAMEPQVADLDHDDPDVNTKIELAQAYEEMGDKEGARELLQEVVQEGSSRQQQIARNKLALLA